MKSFGAIVLVLFVLLGAGCKPDIPSTPNMVHVDASSQIMMGVSQRIPYTKSNRNHVIHWSAESELHYQLAVNDIDGYVDVLIPWQPMGSNSLTLVADVTTESQQRQRLEWRLTVAGQDYALFLAELSRVGERDLYLSGTESPNPVRLNERLNNDQLTHIQLSPAGGSLSYVRENAHSADVFVIVDVTTLEPLDVALSLATQDRIIDTQWANSGLYVSVLVDEFGQNGSTLFVLDAVSGDILSRVQNVRNDLMAWNASGSLLAYRYGTGELGLFDTEDNDFVSIAWPDAGHSASILTSAVAWHSSEDKLALVVNINQAGSQDVVVYDHEENDVRIWVVNDGSQCSATRSANISSLSWAPKGSRLAFMGDLRVSGRVELFSVDLELPQDRACQLVNSSVNTRSIDSYQWSPSGARLGYAIAGFGMQLDIFSSEFSGQNNRQYTTSNTNQIRHWSWFSAGAEERLLFVHYHFSARRAYLYVVLDPSRNEAAELRNEQGEHVSLAGRDTAGIDTILPLVWSNDKTRFMLRGFDANTRASNLFVFDITNRQLTQKTHLVDQNVAADYQWVGSNAGALFRVQSLTNQSVALYFDPKQGPARKLVASEDLAPGGQVFEHFTF